MVKQKIRDVEYTDIKIINNLLRYYNLATPEDIKEGLEWYKKEHQFCLTLAGIYNLPVENVVGAYSALSPQCSIALNRLFLASLLASRNSRRITTHDRSSKARKCLKAQNREEILNALGRSEKGANKTRSFFLNIAYPNETNGITIDRHAFACAIQRPEKISALGEGLKLTEKQYKFLEDCYIKAAQKVNIRPHEFQAILWTVYRRLRNIHEKYKPKNNIVYDSK